MTGSVTTSPLATARNAAFSAYHDARARHTRAELEAIVLDGADGTPTMLVDVLVEDAVLAALEPSGVNVLSEERGFLDRGSAVTVVLDPVDGSANAAAGVPLSCFSAALAVDEVFVEALTCWLHTGDQWAARVGESPYTTSGARSVAGAAVSLLRPHDRNRDAWTRVASRAGRVRVLGCSTLDAALVATGASDAFVDAASDTHRLVDLAAACVLVPGAGGSVVDVWGRPIEFDPDLTRRWSGVVAATPALAEELCALVSDGVGPTA